MQKWPQGMVKFPEALGPIWRTNSKLDRTSVLTFRYSAMIVAAAVAKMMDRRHSTS